ncbi:MAG: type II secretion system F family protein [Candidatus Omnitrophota bacterium]|nr:type II secretion system F family protein [Candidatus Omnitrophota bacterium]
MAKFNYTARDKKGKLVQGSLESINQAELIANLQQQGLTVTFLKQEDLGKKGKGRAEKKLHSGLKLEDLILMSRQLSTLLNAGLTLLRGMDIVIRQIESRSLYLALKEIREDIASGLTFKDALAKHPRIFSDYWLNLVETGESSGKLPATLNQLADYLEAAASFQKRIVSALVYPALLIIVCIAAIVVFLMKIIPTFVEIFEGFNTALPPLTSLVIGLSFVIRRYFIWFIAVICGIIYTAYVYGRTGAGKEMFDRFKLRVPVFGNLIHMLLLARFSRGLATLISSGVPILYGLEIMGKTAGNVIIARALGEVKEGVRDGKTIAGPLEKSGMFPSLLVQMVSVGEETGELGAMLDKVATYYEERVDTFVSRFVSVFEPALLIVMGVIIGGLVISMYLPLFSIAQMGRGM